MTDRERLIELLEDTLHEWECDVQTETLSQIAEHLIENGVIVPPCKVGDRVYFIDTCKTAEDFGKQYVSWSEVLQLTFNSFGKWVLLADKRLLDMDEVFLTKKEAESKLKELNNNA